MAVIQPNLDQYITVLKQCTTNRENQVTDKPVESGNSITDVIQPRNPTKTI